MDIDARLLQEVVGLGIATEDQALQARDRKGQDAGSLLSHLVSVGVPAPQALEAARRVTNIPIAPWEFIRDAQLPPQYGQLGGLLWQVGAAPMGENAGRLRLAFYDPAVALSAGVMGLPHHEPYLALESDVRGALQRCVGPEPSRDTALAGAARARADSKPRIQGGPNPGTGPRPVPQMSVGPMSTSTVNAATEIVGLSEEHTTQPSSEGSSLAPEGKLSERYAIGKKLGQGGMAAVYLANDNENGGAEVALKIMKTELADDEVFVERFAREVRTCAGIQHPNILRVMDFGVDDKRYYMSTEYVDGGAVLDLKRSMGRLPAILAARIIDDILAGLGAAHEAGVVHRDLKPANLLISLRDKRVKIADFGIAKTEGDQTLTQTGMLIGTPAYMAPEQVIHGQCDHRTDLWSAGIVLYELLTGRSPFQEDTSSATLLKVSSGECRGIFEVLPGVPAILETAIEVLLVAEPEERAQSAAEVRTLLQPLLGVNRAQTAELIAQSVLDPENTRTRLLREQAEIEVRRAEGLMLTPEGRQQAALALYRATTIDPSLMRAQELLTQMSMTENWQFGPPQAQPLIEALSELKKAPKNPGLLKRVADLSRAEGNLHASACFLKRYLKVRPEDSHARTQLHALVGSAPMDAHAPGDTSMLTLARKPTARPAATISGWRPPSEVNSGATPSTMMGMHVMRSGPSGAREISDVSAGEFASGFWAQYGSRIVLFLIVFGLLIFCFKAMSWCIVSSREEMGRDYSEKQDALEGQMNDAFKKRIDKMKERNDRMKDRWKKQKLGDN